MITIISHRGYWKDLSEKNLPVAFKRSFDMGFGTETDLRDTPRNGSPMIVISHDMPHGQEMPLEDLLCMAREIKMKHPHHRLPLALNIKADGQAGLLKEMLVRFSDIEYYLFDMAVPDLLQCANTGLRCYTRVSEYEREPSLYDHPYVVGVWLDSFGPIWYGEDLVRKFLADAKDVTLVSPDLHKRMDEFEPYLRWLVKTGLNQEDHLTICTDFPEKAADILLKSS